MTAQEIAAWVDGHWQCAAADLEAGILDDDGSRVTGADWELGLAAYRERHQDAHQQPTHEQITDQ